MVGAGISLVTPRERWNEGDTSTKYFSGVIKINGTSKFTTPSGLKTIIPSGKVIVNYLEFDLFNLFG